jgi:hypothetical protein
MSDTSARVSRLPATPEDLEFFGQIESTLYTAVVADSLDELGYRDQAMREYLRPLFPDCFFGGWARTITCVEFYYMPAEPYTTEIEAVDSILRGEVVVVSTHSTPRGVNCYRPPPAHAEREARSSMVSSGAAC